MKPIEKVSSKINLWTNRRFQEKLIKTVVYMLIFVGAIVFLIPFFWMVSTSLKFPSQVMSFPPEWIPNPIRWENYLRIFHLESIPLILYLKNSLVYCTTVMIGMVMSSSLVAFAFARLRFRGSTTLFFLLLATMMIPFQITMIPLFMFFSRLKWINSYKPLIIPAFFANPYYVFLLRQFFASIPQEMDDAAKIDGCGFFSIYSKIILPSSKPAHGIVAVFCFTATWQGFLYPLIYLNDPEKFPISLGLLTFQQTGGAGAVAGGINWELLMAVSIISLLPVLVLFFIAQKYYIQGIVLTGVKG